MFTSSSLDVSAGFDLFPLLSLFKVVCFELPDISLLGKNLYRREKSLCSRHICLLQSFCFFFFFAFPSVWGICLSKLTLTFRWVLLASVFFCCSCFCEKTGVSLWKLYKLLWVNNEEAITITRDFDCRFLIGWNAFLKCEKVVSQIVIGWRNFSMSFSCDRFYPKISVSMK